MFQIKENASVDFESQWKVKKVSAINSSQTTEYSLVEINTNTVESKTVETQTDVFSEYEAEDVDMDRVAAFLNKMFPLMKKELDEANNSHAFKNYLPFEKSEDPHAKLLQVLKIATQNEEEEAALRVSAISWNSTGNTLVVSSNYTHKSWCHHSGQILFYTFDRNDKLPELPNKKRETDSCITALQFHPTLPYVLAGGTYSGELIVWNIQHDEGDNIVARLSAHEETITEISWINDVSSAKTLLLATASLDGLLVLWNFNPTSSALTVKHKYKIKSPVLATVERKTAVPEDVAKKIVRGILTFDFSPYIPDMFVVGVEGGLVVQCSVLGTRPLKGSTKAIPLSDPVFQYYEPHEGEVATVRFSPNRREMFLSNGTDGELRVYLISQDSPAQVIFLDKTLLDCSWIPYQEKLTCGCGTKGTLEIFHLIKGRPVTNVTKDVVDKSDLVKMALNKKRINVAAIGNDIGELQLWSVPWNLFSLLEE